MYPLIIIYIAKEMKIYSRDARGSVCSFSIRGRSHGCFFFPPVPADENHFYYKIKHLCWCCNTFRAVSSFIKYTCGMLNIFYYDIRLSEGIHRTGFAWQFLRPMSLSRCLVALEAGLTISPAGLNIYAKIF